MREPVDLELEAFSEDRSFRQARQIRDLVRRHRSWLHKVQPDTVERYDQRLWRAAANVRRLARSADVHAYIIRHDRTARGLATIICNQTIVHPKGVELTGNDLDYWLAPHPNEWVHQEAAGRLLSASDSLEGNQPAVFATIPIGRERSYQAAGFRHVLDRIDRNISLQPGPAGDPYDVTRQGAHVDLYGLGLPSINS